MVGIAIALSGLSLAVSAMAFLAARATERIAREAIRDPIFPEMLGWGPDDGR